MRDDYAQTREDVHRHPCFSVERHQVNELAKLRGFKFNGYSLAEDMMSTNDPQHYDFEHATDIELHDLNEQLYQRLLAIRHKTSADYVQVSEYIIAIIKERDCRAGQQTQENNPLATLKLRFQGKSYHVKVFKRQLWIEQPGSENRAFDKNDIEHVDAALAYDPETHLWDFDALARVIAQYEAR
jgi:hypothetical protein